MVNFSLPKIVAAALIVVLLVLAFVYFFYGQPEVASPTLENAQTTAQTFSQEGQLRATESEKFTPILQNDNKVFFIIALMVSLLATLGAVLVSMGIYRWRQVLDNGQTSLVPTVLLEDFQKLSQQVKANTAKQEEQIHLAAGGLESVHLEISTVQEALDIFRTSLDKKDAEINRLKQGSDAIVFHRFLLRFIKVYQAIATEIDQASGSAIPLQTCQELLDLLEGALAESGVEKITPKVGAKYASEYGVADSPKQIPTDDPSLDLTIARIRYDGFKLVSADKPICIKPAVVEIYKHT